MNTNPNEEAPMVSTAGPIRRPGRAAPTVNEPDERFVEELLDTFTDRWEW